MVRRSQGCPITARRDLQTECDRLRKQLKDLGDLTILELQARRTQLETAISNQQTQIEGDRSKAAAAAKAVEAQIQELRKALVVTEDLALLQEVGVYQLQERYAGRAISSARPPA